MDVQFEVVERALGPVVEIEERVPIWRMPATFQQDFPAINDYLISNDAICAGHPYGRYVDIDWVNQIGQGKLAMFFSMLFRKWHLYVGLPASKPLAGEGRFAARSVENRRYARGLHRGPYRDVGKLYAALYAWVIEQGLNPDNEAFEFYLNDPNVVGQANTETEVLIPLL